MPDLPVPEAAVRAVQQIPGSPRGIAGLYEEEIRDILTAAAPHIGAAYIHHATRFEFSDLPEDDFNRPVWTVAAEHRGGDRWAVIRLGHCLGADGDWDYESIPSEREDEWLAAHRFDRDTALRLAEENSHSVTVNGLTAADMLARHNTQEADRG
ncbi:MAG TPA: hypothetical protein VIS06_21250 [Mycobacteriales bacterium]